MLAMALLLHGGLLGGMGGEAGGRRVWGGGAWALATPLEGFLAASETGGPSHLLHLCLFRAFPRGASTEHAQPAVVMVNAHELHASRQKVRP
jgi:hypothetical protein